MAHYTSTRSPAPAHEVMVAANSVAEFQSASSPTARRCRSLSQDKYSSPGVVGLNGEANGEGKFFETLREARSEQRQQTVRANGGRWLPERYITENRKRPGARDTVSNWFPIPFGKIGEASFDRGPNSDSLFRCSGRAPRLDRSNSAPGVYHLEAHAFGCQLLRRKLSRKMQAATVAITGPVSR